MVTPPEAKDDDEPRYTSWLDLPISTREPMTAKDANEARKALIALDDRTPNSGFLVSRRPGAPRWRKEIDNTVAVVLGYPSALTENVVCARWSRSRKGRPSLSLARALRAGRETRRRMGQTCRPIL